MLHKVIVNTIVFRCAELFMRLNIGGELRITSLETMDLDYFPVDWLPTDMLKMHPLWLEDALNPELQPFIR